MLCFIKSFVVLCEIVFSPFVFKEDIIFYRISQLTKDLPQGSDHLGAFIDPVLSPLPPKYVFNSQLILELFYFFTKKAISERSIQALSDCSCVNRREAYALNLLRDQTIWVTEKIFYFLFQMAELDCAWYFFNHYGFSVCCNHQNGSYMAYCFGQICFIVYFRKYCYWKAY